MNPFPSPLFRLELSGLWHFCGLHWSQEASEKFSADLCYGM